ncbi:hypothetical protein Tco_0483338 [Tanacetum coccineum]
MTVMREVNERVTDLAITQRQEAQELYVCCEDAQDDRALLRAQVSLLKREWRTMKAQIRALQRDVSVLQRQRIDDGDRTNDASAILYGMRSIMGNSQLALP